MKSFHLTYVIISVFLFIMVGVTVIAFTRQSNSTGIDPAQIKKMRDRALVQK